MLDEHRNVANIQRKAYNRQKKDLKINELLIEMDFKQKVVIGNYLVKSFEMF